MTTMRITPWVGGLVSMVAAACSPPNGVDYDGGSNGGGGSGGGCPDDLLASCPADAPGYAATIAPILSDHCTSCHGPGGTASNELLGSYAEVHATRGSVLDQVYACRMPPAGSTPLTLTQREALLAWLVCGAPDN
jgi:hypothetical protein